MLPQLLLRLQTSMEVAAIFRPMLASCVCSAVQSLGAFTGGSEQNVLEAIICLIQLMVIAPYLKG